MTLHDLNPQELATVLAGLRLRQTGLLEPEHATDLATGARTFEELDWNAIETLCHRLGAATKPTVWVLTITHRHGCNVTVHRTEEAAKTALDSFVEQYWHELGGNIAIPEDREERFNAYFLNRDDEHATIEAKEVQG